MGKLSFFRWGIRYLNIALFMAYPTMGAIFAMPDLERMTLLRLIIFSFFNMLFIAHVYILNDWSDAKLNPRELEFRDKHALKHPEVMSEGDVLRAAVSKMLRATRASWFDMAMRWFMASGASSAFSSPIPRNLSLNALRIIV